MIVIKVPIFSMSIAGKPAQNLSIAEWVRLLRFSVVGVVASITHYCAVILLVEGATFPPLLANIGGFMVAFGVSFAGHCLWTFSDRAIDKRVSLFRFLGTAVLGFCLNEALFFGLLRFTPIPYFIGLALVIGLVAVGTYFLSRFWAFRGRVIN